MFKRIDIQDQERGLLIRNGRLVRWLEPGRNWVFQGLARMELKLLPRDTVQSAFSPELLAVAPEGMVAEAFVPESCVGLMRVDGVPKGVLVPGRYLLWQMAAKVTLELVNLEALRPEVPESFRSLMPTTLLQTILVLPGERALVHVDGVLQDVLAEGRYAYSLLNRKLEVVRVEGTPEKRSRNTCGPSVGWKGVSWTMA